ncbi:hypothetical protein NQ315_008344 [Exocentrus adspersus]|uniref:Reverse transcriptase domain-containing protein n=1 Tax=Exocentrus adspersus TaxID=1586481 RepID=A0AAV8VS80_9CUCU|nr:hypothetical protein NQ315_008344 [Exocentrus adspersus]
MTVGKIKGIHVQPAGILVSFDVMSLFTKVPLNETLEKLHRRLAMMEKDAILVDVGTACTRATFFALRNQLY